MASDIYDYNGRQDLSSLLHLVERNMKAIQYDTEELYATNEINKDHYPYKTYDSRDMEYWKNHYWNDAKNNTTYRQRQPIDAWQGKPTDIDAWQGKPTDIANWQEKRTTDIANWEEKPRDVLRWEEKPKYVSQEKPKDISYWRNQPKDIAYWQDALERNHQRTYGAWGDYFRQIEMPKKKSNIPKRVQFTNHPDGIVVGDKNLFHDFKNEKEEKNIKNSASLFGDELDSNWIRKFRLDSIETCSRCSKDVFPSELIRLAGKTWHKRCIKCKQCWLTLDDPNNIKMFSDEIYCTRCHNNMITSTIYNWNQEFAPYYRTGLKVESDNWKLKNAIARKHYNDRHNIFDRKPVHDEFGLWNNPYRYAYEHIYENQDAILINNYKNPSKPKKPLKSILKRYKPLPPNPPEYLLLKKRFMHPLSRRYLEEIERKSIRYDNTVEFEAKHLLDNDRVTINLKKQKIHQSAEEGNGFNTVYETILKTARDTWIDEYGVPIRNRRYMFENRLDYKNRSDYVDKEFHLPLYYEERSANVIRDEAVPLRSVARIKQDYFYNNVHKKEEGKKTHSLRRGDVTNKIIEIENLNLISNDVDKNDLGFNTNSYSDEMQHNQIEKSISTKDDSIYQRQDKNTESQKNEIKKEHPSYATDTNEDDNIKQEETAKVAANTDSDVSARPQKGEKVYVAAENSERMHRPSSLKTKSKGKQKNDKPERKKVSFTGKSENIESAGPAVVEFRLSKENRFYVEKMENQRLDDKSVAFRYVGDFKDSGTSNAEKPKSPTASETLSPRRRTYTNVDRKFEKRGSKQKLRDQEVMQKNVDEQHKHEDSPVRQEQGTREETPVHEQLTQVEDKPNETMNDVAAEVPKIEDAEATLNNILPDVDDAPSSSRSQLETINVPLLELEGERKTSNVSNIDQETQKPKMDLTSTFQPYDRQAFSSIVDENHNVKGMKKKNQKSKGFFRKLLGV